MLAAEYRQEARMRDLVREVGVCVCVYFDEEDLATLPFKTVITSFALLRVLSAFVSHH